MDKYKERALFLTLGIAVGFMIGYMVGYTGALNWCYAQAKDFLTLNDVGTDLIKEIMNRLGVR